MITLCVGDPVARVVITATVSLLYMELCWLEVDSLVRCCTFLNRMGFRNLAIYLWQLYSYPALWRLNLHPLVSTITLGCAFKSRFFLKVYS